mmetsp:Transcript_24488/g.36282  ORF Transcript_24488/g.36282 Transcript_24488/m.36282 type:complete len:99 (+) Transcript_24488:48-344(+)
MRVFLNEALATGMVVLEMKFCSVWLKFVSKRTSMSVPSLCLSSLTRSRLIPRRKLSVATYLTYNVREQISRMMAAISEEWEWKSPGFGTRTGKTAHHK